jgi:hypothetical protein
MIFRGLFKVLACSLILLHTSIFAWWDAGHMVVTKIAEKHLHEDVKEQINELIPILSCPDSATFIEASCWLDDVMNRGLSMVSTWHGHAGPYSPDGFLSPQVIAKMPSKYQGNDGIAAIQKGIDTLSNPKSGKWEKAFMLRVLLHVVADIHCPMHCIQLYSKQFPDGDKGGIKFELSGPKELTKKNLHSLWDSILLLDNLGVNNRPLNKTSAQFIERLADTITLAHPKEQFSDQFLEKTVAEWAQESFEAGIEAYRGIEPCTEPSPEYLEKGRSIACQRLALAGYRLAKVLNRAFHQVQVNAATSD